MVYRKTENVLANAEAKRDAIVSATIRIIAQHGIETVETNGVAEEAGVSVGLLYKYFGNKDEILAAVTSTLLNADLAAMRQAGSLAKAIMVFYARMQVSPALVRAMQGRAAYRQGITGIIANYIKEVFDMTPKERAMAAAAALGALYGIFPVCGRSDVAALYALRCIGMTETLANRAIERYSLEGER